MSNKLPKAVAAKTKSAPKVKIVILGYIVLAMLLGALAGLLVKTYSTKTLRIADHAYHLSVAISPAAQQEGLGNRASLPANAGMLFVFSGQTTRCFWMKGMELPLDIIWLNSNKKVVDVIDDISPATYPETFCPPQPAQYVIELNAGQVQLAHITNGLKLSF